MLASAFELVNDYYVTRSYMIKWRESKVLISKYSICICDDNDGDTGTMSTNIPYSLQIWH